MIMPESGRQKKEGVIMKFRPCIDIHNGCVKQIVGGSLNDQGNRAKENFVSGCDARYYARMYKKDGLRGGHIIILNPASSPFYEADLKQAREALAEYPGGLMIGGGINDVNAPDMIKAGASHVIVTSYVFKDGQINFENLKKVYHAVGREHLVLDLSCRKKDGRYMIVTDRWQKFTDTEVSAETLDILYPYCDEFLIHAVDVEGKASGIEKELAALLAGWHKCPITYAGGIGSYDDLKLLYSISNGQLDFTIGSALDLFGGTIPYSDICRFK